MSNTSEESIKVLVNFVGDNTHAEIPLPKVIKFNEKYNEFSKTKKKSLLKAIAIADSLIKGKTKYEKTVNMIKTNNKDIDISSYEDSHSKVQKINEVISKETTNLSKKRNRKRKYLLIKDLINGEDLLRNHNKKNNLKKEESTQDHEIMNNKIDNLINTIIPSKLDSTNNRNEANLSISNSDEYATIKEEIKRDIDYLIYNRINMPSSYNKNYFEQSGKNQAKLN